MRFILSGLALTACDGGGKNSYGSYEKIEIREEVSNTYLQLYSFSVNAKHWRHLSTTDRFIDVSVPSITREIINEGSVHIYLSESGKNLSLPFTYYQVRRAMLFQPSYEEGHAYINILGNFILSVHTTYTFKIIVINKKGMDQFKGLNWYNYKEVETVIDLYDDRDLSKSP